MTLPPPPRRLIILGGSRMGFRRAGTSKIAKPAIFRYNTPIFQTCALLVTHGLLPANTDIYILSPKHGLIKDTDFVASERGATPANMRKVSEFVARALQQLIGTGNYTKIFMDLTDKHMIALEDWETSLPILHATGGPDVRADLLLQWLGVSEQYAAVIPEQARATSLNPTP